MSEATITKAPEATEAGTTLQTLQTKVLTWAELHRGDCQQDAARIMFHSDGTGTFSCTTLTYQTHSGDYWRASFAVKGANGAVLFSLGQFSSPRMSDGNPPPKYPWSAQFSYNPDFFQAISSASQNCSC